MCKGETIKGTVFDKRDVLFLKLSIDVSYIDGGGRVPVAVVQLYSGPWLRPPLALNYFSGEEEEEEKEFKYVVLVEKQKSI